MERIITHGSLFSGIGAAELAASWLGWTNVFHCEINQFSRKVLEYHFPKSIGYEDITKTDFTEWRGRIDILSGGFPCQPFSVAGDRNGAEDDRYLWPEMLRAIRQIQPTWVVGENVAGILSMVQPGEAVKMGSQANIFDEVEDIYNCKQQFIVETVCKDLECEGYSVQPFVIPACAVGAPHKRDRVWFIARLAEDSVGNGCNRWDCKCEEDSKKWQQRLSRTGDSQRICVQEENTVTDSCYSGDESLRKRQAEILPDETFTNATCRRNMSQQESQGTAYEGRTDDGKPKEWRTSAEQSDGLHLFPRFLPRNRREFLSGGTYGLADNSGGERWNSIQYVDGQPQGAQEEECRNEQSCGTDCPQSWWRNFPTVAPICRGNDGIPFDISHLTIPFTRWRQESIKALGNAMVPQVVYEIFRAIENI